MLTELNYRIDSGIEVALLWNSATNETFVSVSDLRTDSEVCFPVSGEEAAEAFRHPYAYMPSAKGNSYPVAA